MPALPPGFYAEWRAQSNARLLLRERDGSHPPERVLQSVWHHQRLLRDRLETVDGLPVRVLHPGFWNHEAGPDFRGALVQIGAEGARSGDIEIDWARSNWQAHHHKGNPAFSNVILHVVWTAEPKGENSLPTLALEKFLDTPLNEMQSWAGSAAAEIWPAALQGVCSGPLGLLSADQTAALLQQAALVRFQRKAQELEIRARQAGWEQALWEGVFRALGYKQNIWPMQRVAELLPLLSEGEDSLLAWQARLLGVSGFLETSSEKSRPAPYFRSLWDHWWTEREKFQDVTLPKTLWRLSGLRPANQPSRRLALAAHWLASKNFLAKLEEWFTTDPPAISLPHSLLEGLQPGEDEFWSRHWSFRSARLGKSQPMLGKSRATDLAINVLLPWFWVRARAGKNAALLERAEQRYLAWPAAQDNSLLRLARNRLLGQRTSGAIKSAANQQGLLQIVRDFCDHSNAVCDDCLFPGLVQSLRPDPCANTTGAARNEVT
ncbi:MAG TPA: DUF2851 family protein [Candidatus Saccharimonadales bacterium]|nr:DUF2851 family protein [Candidatus Saccharimonadales bacterium]